MKTVHIGKIEGNSTVRLLEIFNQNKTDTTFVFDSSSYFIDTVLELENMSNVVFDGNGATFVTQYDRKHYVYTGCGSKSTDLFHFNKCDNITLRRFTVDSEYPVSVAGKIVAINDDSVDVQLFSSTPLDSDDVFIGSEIFMPTSKCDKVPTGGSICISDKKGGYRVSIGGEINPTMGLKTNVPHEQLGDMLFRLYTVDISMICGVSEEEMIGLPCCIYHSYYGLSAFVFKSTCSVTVEDVQIANFGGFGFTVLPRCRDFTFRRVKFKSNDFEHQPFSNNADGIHTTGLGGKLVLEDCYFEYIGDDCLNVHTQVMTVKEITDKGALIAFDKPSGVVSEVWGAKGDRLRIYDAQSLDLKGYVTVESFDNGVIVPTQDSIELSVGDVMTNEAYFVDLEVIGCEMKNLRSRPLVIQSANKVSVRNCRFEGCGSSIYISAAFKRWLEAGPVKNVEIVNNYFGPTLKRWGVTGAVWARIAMDNKMELWHKHENITIRGNTFEGVSFYPVFAYATDGITVEDNTFIDCNPNGKDIHIHNCTDVKVSGNRSVRGGVESEAQASEEVVAVSTADAPAWRGKRY